MDRATGNGPAGMALRAAGVLGHALAAEMVGVPVHRLAAWARGQETPDPEELARLADLVSLLEPLLRAFAPDRAAAWLGSHEPALRARPVDAFRRGGSGPLRQALRARHRGGAGPGPAPG